MTPEQITLAFAEAGNYTDPDAFVSDPTLSSAFSPEDEAAEPDMRLIVALRTIWTAVNCPFADFLAVLGVTQTQLSRRFGIPLRTVQSWALGERQSPSYVTRMIFELLAEI